jgi:hypothetical protein
MIRRVICFLALLGASLLPVRPAEPSTPGQFDSLIKSSPFGQAAPASGVQPGNGTAPLEFRSVLVDHGEYFFSLHETANHASQWVGLKETGQPYVVESYDSEKGLIQVKYHGQSLTLALKLAQVIVQATPPVSQLPTAAPPAAMGPAAQPDDASRLAQVAEEIRRRRALRTQGGPPNLPTASGRSGPGPMIQPNAPNSPARPYVPPVRP